jgi:hypothetical protein
MATFVADLAQAEVAIVELTNAFRRENGAADVRREPRLDEAARKYADFLARSGLFGHEADGRRSVDRIEAVGYTACATAENLASVQRNSGAETRELAEWMVEGWKASAGHRKNLLMGIATETGVAVAKVGASQKYISVQLFGRPVSLEYQFTVENAGPRPVGYSFGGEHFVAHAREVITHTACEPDDVAFEASDMGARGGASRFAVRDGLVLRLAWQPDGTVKVEVREH